MARVPRGPPKRKTRAWDPTPAVNIDNLPPQEQKIVNQNRPKRAKRAEPSSSGFVLDYSQNRESQLRYMRKGRPFYDAAEIVRRQPRSQWRPPPLSSLLLDEEQVSRKPREKFPKRLLGPPSGSDGSDGPGSSGGPRGPGGSGKGVERGTKAVLVAPVTSAIVSSVGTLDVPMTGFYGSSPPPTLPATAKPSSQTIGSRPVPKPAAPPEFKRETKPGPLDAKVAKLMHEYRYLTEDITFNRDPTNYFTLEGLEKYSNHAEAPSQYKISDDALRALGNMFKHYTEKSMGFNSIEGLEQYIRMMYERGESIDLQTKKDHEGKTADPISDGDIEALLSQYSFLIDPYHFVFNSKKALEIFIRHYYETDTLLGPRLPRRPAATPPAPPLAPSSTGVSVPSKTETALEPPIRSLAAVTVDQRVDELMRKWGNLCTGTFGLWSEEEMREHLRERVERDEPLAIPLMSTIKRPPSTALPSIKLPPFKPHWDVSVGGTETTQPRTAKSISIPSVPAEGQEQATKTVNPFSAMVQSPEILSATNPSPVVPKWTAIDKPTKSPEIIDQQPLKDPVKVIKKATKKAKKSAKTAVKEPTKESIPVPSWSSINIPKDPVKVIKKATKKAKKSTKTAGQQPKKDSTQEGGTKDIITPMLKGSIIHPAEVGIGVAATEPPPLTFQPNIGFHYILDLHLEQTTYDNFYFTPTASYLILAGDIGYAHPEKNHAENYREFLARMCAKPVLKRIFMVAGNRDFWPPKKNTIPGALEILRGFAAHPSMLGKLTFMENERFEIEEGGGKVVILGATLWTENRNPGGHEPQDQNNMQKTARHKESCEFIRQETEKIRKDPGEVETRILIITHMPPSKSGTSNPKYTAMRVRDFKSGMNHGSDVIDGVKGYTYDHSEIETTMPLLDHRDVWIWGHTHWNEPLVGKIRHGGMRFECNQRGNAKGPDKKYTPQPKGSFQPEKVIYV